MSMTPCETPKCTGHGTIVIDGWLHLCESCAVDHLQARTRLNAHLATPEAVAARNAESTELAALESSVNR